MGFYILNGWNLSRRQGLYTDTLHDTMHGYITCYKTEKLDAYLRSLSHGIVHILTSWWYRLTCSMRGAWMRWGSGRRQPSVANIPRGKTCVGKNQNINSQENLIANQKIKIKNLNKKPSVANIPRGRTCVGIILNINSQENLIANQKIKIKNLNKNHQWQIFREERPVLE